VKAGWTNVLVGTAGTEQKARTWSMASTSSSWRTPRTDRPRMGRTLVAPIITYVPEGSWERSAGTWASPARSRSRGSLRRTAGGRGAQPQAGGFTNVFFVGESGGNRTGMRAAAEKLNALWGSAARAYWVDDYYTKAHREQEVLAAKILGVPEAQVGNHANILDTSELLFVAPQHIRRDRLVGNDYENNGVSGINQAKSSPEIGRPAAADQDRQRARPGEADDERRRVAHTARAAARGRRRRSWRGPSAAQAAAGRRAPPWTRPRPGRRRRRAPDTVFIDELTWEETRDALKAGARHRHHPHRRHREERVPHGSSASTTSWWRMPRT